MKVGTSGTECAREPGAADSATRILHDTLARAAARGITEVLLTCDKANVGSARTIMNAGGLLVSEELLPGRDDATQRYIIRQDAATPAP